MTFKDPGNNGRQLLQMAAVLAATAEAKNYDGEILQAFIGSSDELKLAEDFLQSVQERWRSHLDTTEPEQARSVDATATAPATAAATDVAAAVVCDVQTDESAQAATQTLAPCEPIPAADTITAAAVAAEADATPNVAALTAGTAPVASAAVTAAVAAPALAIATPAIAAVTAPVTTAAVAAVAPPPKVYPDMKIQLANAKAGQPYEGAFVIAAAAQITIIGVQAPEGIGLFHAPGSTSIQGTPAMAGDFELQVKYHFSDEAEDAPVRIAKVNLTVTPDPRSLWQNLPSDKGVPFWKPDHDAQLMADEKIVAASQRGRSHAHKATCRDDDFFIDTCNGWQIAIVADGAGSARYSREGARRAAQAAGNFIINALANDAALLLAADDIIAAPSAEERNKKQDALKSAFYTVVGHAAHDALKTLSVLASEGGPDGLPVSLADLNTTLLIAVRKQHAGKHIIGSYSIGDGAIGILAGGDVHLGGKPDGGEFSGGTRFLAAAYVQQDQLWERTRAFVLDEAQSIVLLTDGVSDPKFKSDNALEERSAWDALMDEVIAHTGFPSVEDDLAVKLLDWLNFWVPGEHDDRTIAIIW
ncbi:protein phosphatase 2C domain-containing protein [Stenotrophomonas maltophilia]